MQPSVIQASRRRKLQQLAFQESVGLTRDLPKDTVLRALEITLSGSVVTTYASGSPVFGRRGLLRSNHPTYRYRYQRRRLY
jgi:hypothetical protein